MAAEICNPMSQQNHDKIEQTITRERGRLLRFIRRLGVGDDAEDILHDVFYQFVTAYETIESLEKVSSWLFQVARNKIIDRKRKMKPDNFSSLDSWESDEQSTPLLLVNILPDLETLHNKYLRSMIWEKLCTYTLTNVLISSIHWLTSIF